nr:retrovirus-related Pol polyprotein from transposon TNT 1-94 [Tanacetum cinerariifolium]
NKTPYELLHGRSPSIGFMRPFLGKFEGKVDEGFLVGYSVNSKSFKVFNSRTRIVHETLHVNFLENKPNIVDAAFDEKEHDAKKPESEVNVSPSSSAYTNPFSAAGPSNTTASPTHGKSSFKDASKLPDDPDMPELEDITYSNDENVVGAEADFNNLETSITEEPKRVHQALKDPSWIEAMQEEILQFKMQKEEGIDYEEVFAQVERIEAIRLFLAYVSFMGFMVYQIDVKSAFLYGTIEEEVYVYQPPGFKDPDHPNKFYKMVKALYGLHQDPRAWNKKNKRGIVIRNKVRLVAQGHTQEEGIDYDEKVFANMRRVGKGFSRVETPLFEGMLVGREIEEEGDEDEHVEDVIAGDDAQEDVTAAQGDDAQELSIPSPTLPTLPPQPPQDLPSTSHVQHTPPQSPQAQLQTQPQLQPAPDFPMSLLYEALDACATLTKRVEHLEYDKVAQALEITKLKRRVKKLEKGNKFKVLKLRRLKRIGTSQRIDTSDDTVMDDESNQGRIIDEIDKDDDVALMDDKEEDKKAKEAKVIENAQKDEPTEVHEVVDVVTTDKLITEVVTAASEAVTAASTIISGAEPQVHAATIITAPVKIVAAPSKRRKGVVIRDPEEESTTSSIIPTKTKTKDKGKGILVEEPKPLKRKQRNEMDEEYAKTLHAEINKDIDWDVAIDHVKLKAKEDPTVQRYQAMKRKPHIEAQAQKNMMMYLKNVMEKEESRALQRINETPTKRAAKRRKLNEEVEDLKRHLEIVPDEDDDVYTEATPLVRKVPVVDYEIIEINNKPYYKIIRADGTHQLYISFLALLKNFDKEDLEALWSLVKERFSTAKPKNFSDDFLLSTLGAMFEKPDA